MTLAEFQDRFSQALLAQPAEPLALAAQPAFAIYRNTVVRGWVEALCANYPSVLRLVGDDWFRAAASIYARERPARDARLLQFGDDFAEFIERFEPAAELPYLPGVARLDRFWTEVHGAQDDAPLDASLLACLTPDALADTVLRPHAAARWGWFADLPIYTIWRRNREAVDDEVDLDWHAEGALLTRPADAVAWCAVDAAACAFLDSCAAGRPLADAVVAAVEAQADVDLAGLMANLLAAGAFAALEPSS